MSAFPPDLEAFVQQKLASGQFGSREELTVEAVRLFRSLEQQRDQLRADIQAAIEQSEQGLSKPFDADAIKAKLHQRLSEQGWPS